MVSSKKVGEPAERRRAKGEEMAGPDVNTTAASINVTSVITGNLREGLLVRQYAHTWVFERRAEPGRAKQQGVGRGEMRRNSTEEEEEEEEEEKEEHGVAQEWRNGVGRTLHDGMGVIAMRRGCSLTFYRDFATMLLI